MCLSLDTKHVLSHGMGVWDIAMMRYDGQWHALSNMGLS